MMRKKTAFYTLLLALGLALPAFADGMVEFTQPLSTGGGGGSTSGTVTIQPGQVGYGVGTNAVGGNDNLTTDGSGNVTSAGIISAVSFQGDGSALTGIAAVTPTWGSISGTPAGVVNISNTTGDVTATRFAGSISGTNGYFSNVSGTTGAFGTVTSTNVYASAVSGTTGTFGNINTGSLTATGTVSANALDSFFVSGTNITGVTGTFTGATMGTLAVSGVVSAGTVSASTYTGNGAGLATLNWYALTPPTGVAAISNTALTTAILGQLQNIGSNSIGSTQWGNVASLNQSVSSTATPTFGGITATGTTTATSINASGTISATAFVGSGAGLTDLPVGGTPQAIVSGTTNVTANGNTNTISFTTNGTNAAYIDATGREVVAGISVTTNQTSVTTLLASGAVRGLAGANISGTTNADTMNVVGTLTFGSCPACGGGGDNITSGTTKVTANSNGYISLTTGGTTTGYFDTTGRLIVPGISVTTAQTSVTSLSVSGAVTVTSVSGTTTGMVLLGNTNNFYQYNCKNSSTGSNASCDYVSTADDGSDTTHYADFGINNSNGSQSPFNNAHAAYLYNIDNELDLGAAQFVATAIISGTTPTEVMRVTSLGVSTTGSISATGTISASAFYGDGSHLTGISGGSGTLISTTTFTQPSNISNSTAIGFNAGVGTGVSNTSYGAYASNANTTGRRNTSGGAGALRANTTQDDNTAFGYNAYKGAGSVAIGQTSAFGSGALVVFNPTAQGSDAFGYNSLGSLVGSGGQDAAFGINSLSALTTGASNSGFGFNSGSGANSASTLNVFMGTNAGGNNGSVVIISNSVFIGNAVGSNMGAANTINNVIIGSTAGQSIGGSSNTVAGFAAAKILSTGQGDVVLGAAAAGTLTIGNNDIIIGTLASVPTSSTSLFLNVGNAVSGSMTVSGTLTHLGAIATGGSYTDGSACPAGAIRTSPVYQSLAYCLTAGLGWNIMPSNTALLSPITVSNSGL